MFIIVKIFKQWCYYLKESSHLIKILMNYNNLYKFIKIKNLNKRQTKWIIKLVIFDFIILHQLDKKNLTDALLKWLNYIKNVNERVSQLLFNLQWKLTVISF